MKIRFWAFAATLTATAALASASPFYAQDANIMIFEKVDFFEMVQQSDGDMDEKKHDARLEIDSESQRLLVTDEDRGAERATFAEIPFSTITDVIYEQSKSPRVKTAIFLSPLALFSPGRKHWLTVEYEGGFTYMRLDKNNQRQIRAALGAAGFDVQTIIED